ncbi:MAG TPA: hypothetical protein VJN94_03305 [Candidatus Binataceae bacterium]|nr:hypothetical protein [Candidatus Binataceae bacterium]
MPSIDEIVLGLEARDARIGKLYIDHREPAFAEYRKLKWVLRKHALETHEEALLEWLATEQAKFNENNEGVTKAFADKDDQEMAIRHHNLTADEIVASWRHIDKLSQLAEAKLEAHIQYLRDLNTSLKAKIAEKHLFLNRH